MESRIGRNEIPAPIDSIVTWFRVLFHHQIQKAPVILPVPAKRKARPLNFKDSDGACLAKKNFDPCDYTGPCTGCAVGHAQILIGKQAGYK
jgi:hypothetical protein